MRALLILEIMQLLVIGGEDGRILTLNMRRGPLDYSYMEKAKWLILGVAVLLVAVVILADTLGVPPHVARLIRDALALLLAAAALGPRLFGS